ELWLVGLMIFNFMALIVIITSRKHINFQMYLFLPSYVIVTMTKRRQRNGIDQDPLIKNQRKMDIQIAGVYLAERLNVVLSDNWKSFARQIYCNRHGVFLSMVWSGILLIFATIILKMIIYFPTLPVGLPNESDVDSLTSAYNSDIHLSKMNPDTHLSAQPSEKLNIRDQLQVNLEGYTLEDTEYLRRGKNIYLPQWHIQVTL
nr:hypothetical protein [Tanacetum cinerariifolium]